MPPDPLEKRASHAIIIKNSFQKKACFGNACSPALPVPEQLPYPGYATVEHWECGSIGSESIVRGSNALTPNAPPLPMLPPSQCSTPPNNPTPSNALMRTSALSSGVDKSLLVGVPYRCYIQVPFSLFLLLNRHYITLLCRKYTYIKYCTNQSRLVFCPKPGRLGMNRGVLFIYWTYSGPNFSTSSGSS